MNPNPSQGGCPESPRLVFLGVFSFPNCTHLIAFWIMGSLFWASSQSMTCISSFGAWVVDYPYLFPLSSPHWLVRTVNSAWSGHPTVVLSKMALTSWAFSDFICPAESISSSIIPTMLIFDGEVKVGKRGHPSMSTCIEVRGGKKISEGIIISLHNKKLVNEILLKNDL